VLFNKKRGFTLIELLVVIAIIAILAAILFPVFARAREKARTASCQSNQKEIALAFKMYIGDFDEKYPGGAEAVAEIIFPYIQNVQIYHCPSDSNLGAGNEVSYAYNDTVAEVSEAQCESVVTTILTTDAESSDDMDGAPASERHSDGANYSFLDGHVKWYRPGQIDWGGFSTDRPCTEYEP